VHPFAHVDADAGKGWQNHPHADDRDGSIVLAKLFQANGIEIVAKDVRPNQETIDIWLAGNIKEDVFLGFVLLRPARDSSGKTDQVYISLRGSVGHRMPQVDLGRPIKPCGQHSNSNGTRRTRGGRRKEHG